MRITVQLFDVGRGEDHAKTIYCHWDDIPLGMSNEKCAHWMLAKAQEKFAPQSTQKRHD